VTTKELLNLDCREDGSIELLQKALRLIPPLAKYDTEDIPVHKIEKAITVLTKKYNMRIRELVPDVWANEKEVIWRSTIINDNNLATAQIVYGISLYECLAKTAICMYSLRKKVDTR
jgi:hypothetical protein